MSVKLPSYPKYKDSGVKWLGNVPEHWEASISDGFAKHLFRWHT